MAKLDKAKADAIREEYERGQATRVSMADLAKKYGVVKSVIQAIIEGKIYK